ncbi:hypothetical protein BN1708_020322, partial [Verticillium longisporum]
EEDFQGPRSWRCGRCEEARGKRRAHRQDGQAWLHPRPCHP